MNIDQIHTPHLSSEWHYVTRHAVEQHFRELAGYVVELSREVDLLKSRLDDLEARVRDCESNRTDSGGGQ